jgi:quinol monooxygenase YgiN
MITLRIEHAISDYATWKAAFDRDPAFRKQSGVRRYAIHRPVDDPHYVMIDLTFDSVTDAEAMLTRLQEVWQSAAAAAALAGAPESRIIDIVETVEL